MRSTVTPFRVKSISLFFIDCAVVAFVLCVSYGIVLLNNRTATQDILRTIPVCIVFYAVVQGFLFYMFDAYSIKSDFRKTKSIFKLVLPVVLASWLFYGISRWLPHTFSPGMLSVQAVSLVGLCYLWRYLFFHKSICGKKVERVAVVGGGKLLRELAEDIRHYDLQKFDLLEMDMGDPEDFEEKTRRLLGKVDAIVTSPPHYARLRSLFPAASPSRPRVYDAAEFYSVLYSTIPLSSITDAWASLHSKDISRGKLFWRIFEVICASLILVATLPIFSIIAILIKMDSKGPIFFRQKRVGLGGKLFTILKFRTMEDMPKGGGNALTGDRRPRVTGVGRILRRIHMDELPQFINVLKGDMGLIGPRPISQELESHLEKVIPYHSIRYSIRPGITGWATVNYYVSHAVDEKDEISEFARILESDLFYIYNASLILDLYILLKTVKITLRGCFR